MTMHDLEPVTVSKFVTQLIESVTCLECCKYYLIPETATCGHTLCHGCWSGRRFCADCAKPLDRKALKVNIQIQKLTEHVRLLVEGFEQLFNIKLDEMVFNKPNINNKDPRNEQIKHVKDWLIDSQNHFSVPPSNSQGFQSIILSPNKIQLHEETKKATNSAKLVQVPLAKDDWDKIDAFSDTEELCTKKKDNVIGPMDIEPYHVHDNEYTTENPRRSSRNKDTKNNHQNSELHGVSKQDSYNSGTDETNKINKNAKQNWNNVKKMRKEFSKLNKKKRNKLNISIEMCKRAQSTIIKSNATTPPIVSDQIPYVIDDNTQNILNTEEEVVTRNKTVLKDNDVNIDPLLESGKYEHNKVYKDTNINNIKNDNNDSKQNSNSDKDLTKSQFKINNDCDITDKEVAMNKIPFFKKSALLFNDTKKSQIKTDSSTTDKDITALDTNMDDIEINIRIGNTLTNICIKKKNNDIQIKANTDREIQTSLGPYTVTAQNKPSSIGTIKVRDMEFDLENNGGEVHTKILTKKHVSTQALVKNADKSILNNKDTASADTLTAQFKITKSVDKELSQITENDTIKNKTIKKDKTIKEITNVAQSTNVMKATQEEMAYINDLDVFESDSPKEARVQFLRNTEPTQSEILESTIKSLKVKNTQKHSEKRNRDIDKEEQPPNKKAKINKEIEIQQIKNEQIDNKQNKNNEHDSENYDVITSQMFANIDADIEYIQKTQHTQKNTDNKKQSHSEIDTKQSQHIIKNKLQQITTLAKTKVTNNGLENLKDSENVFSLHENDNIRLSVSKANDQIPGSETQRNIDNLLTPGIYLESIPDGMQTDDVEMTQKTLCTPTAQNEDDSDKSVVEETPQKNLSFSKHKTKTDPITKQDNGNNKHEIKKSQIKLQENINIEHISGVIDLSDTIISNTNEKNATVIETDNKKTLDTPPTINKFVDLIKHKSTPVARKSLNFEKDNIEYNKDPDQTVCSISLVAKTTLEKEFMSKAFEQTPESQIRHPLSVKNIQAIQNKKLYVGGSCLTSEELTNVKLLCVKRNWIWVDKYTKDLTHLIVGVDYENKSQRTVKYMSALAAGKWIVSFAWVQKCLHTNEIVNEEPFEVLDNTGEPGPRRSRLAKQKLFHGITFYCMPPFTILDIDILKEMLEAAGGRVVGEARSVRAIPTAPALLLAEPENTQEDRFMYLAMELSIVPVNYEWVLNCLGSYTLNSVHELLLCPASLLPTATASWPEALIALDDD